MHASKRRTHRGRVIREGRGEMRCVYCGQARPGLRVREDYVIKAMRWFNRSVLHKYRNYTLVVCKECYPTYKKSRAKYARKQITYVVIGFLFAGLLVAVSGGNAFAFLYGMAVIVFMYALSLISYVPSLKEEEGARVRTNKLK